MSVSDTRISVSVVPCVLVSSDLATNMSKKTLKDRLPIINIDTLDELVTNQDLSFIDIMQGGNMSLKRNHPPRSAHRVCGQGTLLRLQQQHYVAQEP